jgi:catechol 2,3-dioxygenase-like lactoylglutathione lyase family enzyme
VTGVVAVGITVGDAERSAAFYRDVLGFEKVTETEVAGPAYDRLWGISGAHARVVRLRLGSETLELTEFLTPRGRPYPEGSRSNDRWFQHVAIVVSDMDAAYARIRPHVRAISTAPQILPRSNPAAAGIAAFYFRDPDGHPLELIHFPPGKGEPRWQTFAGRLFLGIDHTAIGVGATAASLAFYRDALGLRIGGASHNVGGEQVRLTGVAGADVRITGLRPARAIPGIELLEYAGPRDGRPFPSDARVNDLVHSQTMVAVDDVAAATVALRDRGYRLVSEPVLVPDTTLGYAHAALVDDPDGHALELVSP